jgi:hypothetical protein
VRDLLFSGYDGASAYVMVDVELLLGAYFGRFSSFGLSALEDISPSCKRLAACVSFTRRSLAMEDDELEKPFFALKVDLLNIENEKGGCAAFV